MFDLTITIAICAGRWSGVRGDPLELRRDMSDIGSREPGKLNPSVVISGKGETRT